RRIGVERKTVGIGEEVGVDLRGEACLLFGALGTREGVDEFVDLRVRVTGEVGEGRVAAIDRARGTGTEARRVPGEERGVIRTGDAEQASPVGARAVADGETRPRGALLDEGELRTAPLARGVEEHAHSR